MSNEFRNLLNLLEANQREFSPQFMAWFRGSRVVDDYGNPMMVFRGNRRVPSAVGYKLQRGRATPSFVPDPEIASVYTRQLNTMQYGAGSNITPVYLSIKNPFDIRQLGEMVDLSDLVAMLNYDWRIEHGLKSGKLGYGDLSFIVFGMQETIESVRAQYRIQASDGEGWVVRDFEEFSELIEEYGAAEDYDELEALLIGTTVDAYVIGDNPQWIQALKYLGYDGIIHYDIFEAGVKHLADPSRLDTGDTDVPTHVTYRPFYQNQIKSATGNIGTYDPEQDDVTKESEQ